MNLLYRIIIGKATLEDQYEALEHPWSAYEFSFYVPGADIEKYQEAACKDPKWAYMFAVCIKEADLAKIKELCPKISDKIDELIMNRVLV